MSRPVIVAGTMLAIVVTSSFVLVSAQTATTAPAADIRVGLIRLHTSHAGGFTQLLNDAARPDHVPGARVVAAVKGGSPDIEASTTRIEKFTAELRDTPKIEAGDSLYE